MQLKKQSILSVVVVVCAIFLLLAGRGETVYASERLQYNALSDFSYKITDDALTITGYTGTSEEVLIAPSYTVKGKQYTVTEIGAAAFEAQANITYVVLPETIETVGEYAFYDCMTLKTIVVKGRETEIGAGAFGLYYVSRLEDGVVEGFVLEGYAGSTAEAYATKNGLIFRAPADEAVDLNGILYTTLADAVAAAKTGDTLRLNREMAETLTIDKNITLDLCGHGINGIITVAEGSALTVKDSSTDDFSAVDYGVIQTVGNAQPEKGYLAIAEENGTSYHRLDLDISSVNLRPATVGIYYGGKFGGDEAIKAQVETYGTALSLTGTPTAAEILADKNYSRHTAFSGESWVCGGIEKSYGTLLKGIWKETNSQEANKANAERKIYSVSYIQLKDGTIILGQPVSMSLRDVVEKVDTIWDSLDEKQIAGMQAMYAAQESLVADWNIPNLLRSGSYRVTFRDYDGILLETRYVRPGDKLELPADPSRPGYTFTGWNKDLTEIAGDLDVFATYSAAHNQLYFDFKTSGKTVTATLHVKGDVKLYGLEAQLRCTLNGMTLESVTPIAEGLGVSQKGNTVMLSYVTTTGKNLTAETELLQMTFRITADDPTASIALENVDIFDEVYADEIYTVAGNTYGN